jgi:hypothetical protein
VVSPVQVRVSPSPKGLQIGSLPVWVTEAPDGFTGSSAFSGRFGAASSRSEPVMRSEAGGYVELLDLASGLPLGASEPHERPQARIACREPLLAASGGSSTPTHPPVILAQLT